jgi:hypothetical protein
MRYLAAATLCIFVYLFLQLLHTPQTEIHLPSSGSSSSGRLPGLQHSTLDRDPQLDRMTDSILQFTITLVAYQSTRWLAG